MNKKKVENGPKKYFNQLLGARSTQKLVKIQNKLFRIEKGLVVWSEEYVLLHLLENYLLFSILVVALMTRHLNTDNGWLFKKSHNF